MTYLNFFFHLVKFRCVIFHLFSTALQVLCHATHCSIHNTYVFGIIHYHFVQYPNRLTLLGNYPKNITTFNIPFGTTLTNFRNVNSQQIIFVKTRNPFILPFMKCLYWNFCVWKNGNWFVMEVMMGWILIPTWRFIPNNF